QSLDQHPDIANLRWDEASHESLEVDRCVAVEERLRASLPRACSNPLERGLLISENAALHVALVCHALQLQAVRRCRYDRWKLSEAPLRNDDLHCLQPMACDFVVLSREVSRVDDHRPR